MSHFPTGLITSKKKVAMTFVPTYIYIYIYIYISLECSAQEQVLHCKRRKHGCSSVEGRSPTANSGNKAAVLPGKIRCGSFPLLSAPHPLFSIWIDLKRSEKIPGAPTWRWGEWIWLTGPSRTSPIFTIGVKYQFYQKHSLRNNCIFIYFIFFRHHRQEMSKYNLRSQLQK